MLCESMCPFPGSLEACAPDREGGGLDLCCLRQQLPDPGSIDTERSRIGIYFRRAWAFLCDPGHIRLRSKADCRVPLAPAAAEANGRRFPALAPAVCPLGCHLGCRLTGLGCTATAVAEACGCLTCLTGTSSHCAPRPSLGAGPPAPI